MISVAVVSVVSVRDIIDDGLGRIPDQPHLRPDDESRSDGDNPNDRQRDPVLREVLATVVARNPSLTSEHPSGPIARSVLGVLAHAIGILPAHTRVATAAPGRASADPQPAPFRFTRRVVHPPPPSCSPNPCSS